MEHAALQTSAALTLWTVWIVHPKLSHPPTWSLPVGLGDHFHWPPMPAAHELASECFVLPSEAQLAMLRKAGNVEEILGLGGRPQVVGAGVDAEGTQDHWGVLTVAVVSRKIHGVHVH